MKNIDMGKDKLLPLIITLAVPAMLAQLVNVLYGIVDRIFISNMPNIGELALAGVGVCGPVVTLITSFSFLLSLGGAPLMAMAMGEGNNGKAKKIMFNCSAVLCIFSIVLTVIFLIFKHQLLLFFGATAESVVYAEEYMTTYLYGTVFALLSMGLNGFITAQGYSKTAMGTTLIGAVLNIALDPLFIFTFNMGVMGAALATVISQFCSFLWALLFLISKRSKIRLAVSPLDGKIIGKVMRNGLSPFIIMATDSIIVLILNMVIKNVGGDMSNMHMASATIVVSFMQLIIMPMGGLTMACQPIVSFNYGQKNFARVKGAIKRCIGVCLVFTSAMFVVSFFLPHGFVAIFTSDPTVTKLAIEGIKLYTLGIIILSFQYCLIDMLVALSASAVAVTLSLNRKIALMTLTVVLPLFIGVPGVFLAEPIADTYGSIVSTLVSFFAIPKILKKREAEIVIVEPEVNIDNAKS